jgi:glycine cleavage system H protein
MNIPENLYYTQEHEWVRVESDDLVVVGITDFAQKELGDIVYIEVETEGEELEKDEEFGSVEAVKTVSDLFMPISGEVIAVNEALEDEPEMINAAPYEAWIIKIKPSNLQEELGGLMNAADYRGLIDAS